MKPTYGTLGLFIEASTDAVNSSSKSRRKIALESDIKHFAAALQPNKDLLKISDGGGERAVTAFLAPTKKDPVHELRFRFRLTPQGVRQIHRALRELFALAVRLKERGFEARIFVDTFVAQVM